MAELIKLPAVAADSAGGSLSRWLKQEGDAVRAGDVLAEIETDKAVVEIAAEGGGVLARVIVDAGPAQLSVNTVLGVIREDGEQDAEVARALAQAGVGEAGPGDAGGRAAASDSASESPALESPAAFAAASSGRGRATEAAAIESGAGAMACAPAPESDRGNAAKDGAIAPGGECAGQRVPASPLARRVALERGIALEGLAGSGPRGRIVKRDVERAAQAGTASTSMRGVAASDAVGSDALGSGVAASDAVASGAAASSGNAAGETASRGSASSAAAPDASASPAPSVRTPHSNMRRTIARRLGDSKRSVPHFYLTVDCRMDALLDLREQANAQGARRLSVNDFIVKAAALALVEVPEVNVSWEPDVLVRHASADISVAVATDGGLTTPIVRGAGHKPLGQIADEIAMLAARAREHRLRPEDYTGGSMTISNLGMYGVREFAAIINPPQAAILAVGAAERRAIVDAQGALVAARVMTVTLSADHRAVDGAVGARWLAAFRGLVENPLRILL
ncbi:2-oxo acid dehydrogenase subunit E2 [Bordetella genomosp. 13]|uniref:2-oxo acid dehydrogenase subunit E2 n=1 Tax=Bordetella genomosp. 13 TaxID=463040 RepID=UPI00119EDF9C|nr:2-oxo acid dehydrogenase subunit E2 [Bordetella genomosp. 13]